MSSVMKTFLHRCQWLWVGACLCWAWGADATPDPPGWYGRIEMGLGYTEPLGQLERSLDGSPVLSGRMMLGAGYRAWSLGLVLAGTNLQSDAVDLGLNDLWCQVFALGTGYDFTLWQDTDAVARLGLTARVEGGWAVLGGGDYDHHGPQIGTGLALFYEDAAYPGDPFRYRWWLDAGWSLLALESNTLNRYINAEWLMISVGFSTLVWGV
jgi:hypothetical protein